MKTNNTIKIAEIGLNHLGSERIAKKYLGFLVNSNVDGISFQIKKEIFYKEFKLAFYKKDISFSKNFRERKFFLKTLKTNKFKRLTLTNNFYRYAIKLCKNKKKMVGFAVTAKKK